ncbi:MAG: MBL fold metallo-hydrolase [Nitrolancea sp.]
MRLTVLGGSAACPNPGDASSSYLIEHDGVRMVLDCGPGSVPVLRRFTALRDVGAVLISHLHSDHTIDLVPFRYGLRYIPGGRGPRVPLWVPPDGINFLKRLEDVFASGPERGEPFFENEFGVNEYDPESAVDVGPFHITFTPTQHFIPCWAMRIECDGRSIVYLADTNYQESLAQFASKADLLVCEATMPTQPPDAPKSAGHLTGVESGRLAELSHTKHLLLTHIWQENGIAQTAAHARESFDGAITVAQSGVQITV